MRTYDQYCALARALDHVGHRWTLLIVRELLLGPRRFTDLRAGLPGIANNLLADRLRQLQDDGLVTRRELPPPAASSVYELTDAGRDLRGAIEALIRWGGRFMLSGRGGDHFRAGWLVLALDALGVAGRMDAGTVVEMVVDGETVRLTVAGGHLAVAGPDGPGPDFRVTADAPTLLGVAAGALPVEEAVRAVRLDPGDPGTVGAFLGILAPAADG